MSETIKCVILGDGNVGKTCALIAYTTHKFPSQHVPTVFDNYMLRVKVGGYPYTLNVFDTAGKINDRLRPLSYPKTDVFLLCFSVLDRVSFSRIGTFWTSELRQQQQQQQQHHQWTHSEVVPIILVGTKIDLRDDQTGVTFTEGEKLAKQLNFTKYVECSALTQKGLKNVFDEAILAALNTSVSVKKKKNKLNCVLL